MREALWNIRIFLYSVRGADGKSYGGEVIANDEDHAKLILDARGLGEKYEGELIESGDFIERPNGLPPGIVPKFRKEEE